MGGWRGKDMGIDRSRLRRAGLEIKTLSGIPFAFVGKYRPPVKKNGRGGFAIPTAAQFYRKRSVGYSISACKEIY